MSRFKTKLARKHNDHKEFLFENMPETSSQEMDEMGVVRRKNFDVIPMSVDEAIMQMELLGHTFYIFLNMETSSINVVYKRKNGDYGLLEPRY
jgi:putative sigma-54 modulation protein